MVDQRLTFQEIMAVESVGEDRYMSLCPAWAPNGRAAYGGIVYAQATWAAAQTVEEGLIVHVLNTAFLFCTALTRYRALMDILRFLGLLIDHIFSLLSRLVKVDHIVPVQ